MFGPNTQQTLRAYQRAYDDAAIALQQKLANGSLTPPAGLNQKTWEGNWIDSAARAEMNAFKQMNGMDDLLVNRRLNTPGGDANYRIPDLFLPGERTAIDGTIGFKDVNTPQIQDIFHSGKADTVILVSPGVKPKVITIQDYQATLPR